MLPKSSILPLNNIISVQQISDKGKLKVVLMGPGGCCIFPLEIMFSIFKKSLNEKLFRRMKKYKYKFSFNIFLLNNIVINIDHKIV